MHMLTRTAATMGLLGLAIAGPLGGVHHTFAASDVVGYVYVNDNTAGTNTVAGFDRHADGTLTPLPGSPFTVGGSGLGTGIPSQDALQISGDGRYLLAVDAGSNQISVLRIHHDGSLQPAEGSPFASGGSEPVSIAARGSLVYVANTGTGGANYAGFTLNSGGHLQPLAGATAPVPDGSGLGDVLFNADGTRLVGIRVNTSLIDSFVVGADGHPTAASGSPFAAQGPGPFGSEFRPTNPAQLFVSIAHGGAGNGEVSAYSDAADGTLSPIGASPYADQQTAPCWVTISSDGQYLFTANTASGTISSYRINADGSLALLGSTPLTGAPSPRPTDVRIAPDNNTLYVLDAGDKAVNAFRATGGSLTELAPAPVALPAGATPSGLVVTGSPDSEE